jgi:D-alanyl-D-alanine dipeptidase
MLVVIPETAAGPHASLSFYEKEAAGWRRVLGPHPVLIGSKGWAWGRGPLFSAPPGPTKREGDLKAPAGVFALGKAYGRDAGFATRWPYVALSQDIRAIEDPASRYYNQVVDRRTIPAARQDWRQSVGLGKFLVFIEHNWPAPVPGAGSALFLHVWESPGTPSFGCTVAAEAVVRAVIARLDPTRQARLALLPREYLPAVFR